jgi:uncharacterized membrane protein YtjA (UPF0391 family)
LRVYTPDHLTFLGERFGVAVRCVLTFPPQQEEAVGNLLYWAVVFLVVAIIAAALGFGGVAGTALAGAKILFWVAIVLFVIALIGGLATRGRI